MIGVRDLVKDFRTPKRHPGLLGSLRTLFTSEQTVTRAVDGVSFEVDEGELVGYLGPNGAGKAEYAPHRVLVVHLASELDVIDAPGAEQIGREDGRVSVRFDPEQTRVADLIGAITSRYPVTDLSIVEPDLEGVIKQIYGEREPHR